MNNTNMGLHHIAMAVRLGKFDVAVERIEVQRQRREQGIVTVIEGAAQ
jgi:hypothetical protein